MSIHNFVMRNILTMNFRLLLFFNFPLTVTHTLFSDNFNNSNQIDEECKRNLNTFEAN